MIAMRSNNNVVGENLSMWTRIDLWKIQQDDTLKITTYSRKILKIDYRY